jgi:type I restriction-modification system DNA methylase subunit/uncharacterized protein (DUF433 family)/3-phenylpropionate/cinnamic acid dioxygenase small subunit
MTSTTLQNILHQIGDTCNRRPLTEAEVEKLFIERGFFRALGYSGIGLDIWAQRGKKRKRFDLALCVFGGRVKVVIELKKTAVSDLETFSEDLEIKYVVPQLAEYGAITNGVRFLLYKREGETLHKVCDFELIKATKEDADQLIETLKKESVELSELKEVENYLLRVLANPIYVTRPEDEGGKIFLQVFQLEPKSTFGKLTAAIVDLLKKLRHRSNFVDGSYEFWLKTYARELDQEKVPENWEGFLVFNAKDSLYNFAFAVETAYALLSRLMLAKAAHDFSFPGLPVTEMILSELGHGSARGQIKPEAYADVVIAIFDKSAKELFGSIFETDIFDWWRDYPQADQPEGFLKAVGESLLVLSQFNFSELSGDLLGGLYQAYFDAETRKALGEFYTPHQIIDLILDEVEYQGQRHTRLLDPSCGSGSFLVAALRRYLKNFGQDSPARVLKELIEGFRIVGFDINPFAVLISQVNFATQILPLYAEAIKENREFVIARLPIFRTDSLRQEKSEAERELETAPRGLFVSLHEDSLSVKVDLPIKAAKKKFLKIAVSVPRYDIAYGKGLISNPEEYFNALELLFKGVKEGELSQGQLAKILAPRFPSTGAKLAEFLLPAAEDLVKTLEDLTKNYGDGRFLKTLEDLVLALLLKHHFNYDYLVGNPPYIRIQKIPEHVREYWQEEYEWATGNYDIYIPFIERGIEWLKEGGKLGFIVSDRFLMADYGEKLRDKLPERAEIKQIIDLRDTRVFKDALNYPAVISLEKKSTRSKPNFSALRVFGDPEGGADELIAEMRDIGKGLSGLWYKCGNFSEAFTVPKSDLAARGWYLMPKHERKVFEKIEKASDIRLSDLTITKSGAFAGYQTSADNIFVLYEIEDLGKTITAYPKGEPNEIIEIEKEILRPFLFGKDIERWYIDWQKSYVIFPYFRCTTLLKSEKGEEEKEGWGLIPCKENRKRFNYVGKVELIEDLYPKAWRYLKRKEAELRERENGIYRKGKPKEHVWYGAARPQNLENYEEKKILVQLNSRSATMAYDEEGQFAFQAGGKGGGVYGVLPNLSLVDLTYLLALLNSKVIDFYLKQTSSVYSGKYYSYADQFIKQIPIVLPKNKEQQAIAEQIKDLARQIIKDKSQLQRKQDELRNFPEKQLQKLRNREAYPLDRLVRAYPHTENIGLNEDQAHFEQRGGSPKVYLNSTNFFEFDSPEHARLFLKYVRLQHRQTLKLSDLLKVRFPSSPSDCAKLLKLALDLEKEISSLRSTIKEAETNINELALNLYGISDVESTKVIDDFLMRFGNYVHYEEVEELATKYNKPQKAILDELAAEAIKMRRCPGIIFTDGATGRRATIVGTGIDVWEAISVYKSCNEDFSKFKKAMHWLSTGQLQAALNYYHSYPDEINARIRQNEMLTEDYVRQKYPFLFAEK